MVLGRSDSGIGGMVASMMVELPPLKKGDRDCMDAGGRATHGAVAEGGFV